MEERTRLQKILLAVLAVMAAVFALLTLTLRRQYVVEFRGEALRWTDTAEGSVYTGRLPLDGGKAKGTITVVRQTQQAETILTLAPEGAEPETYRVEFPLQAIPESSSPISGLRIWYGEELVFRGGYHPGANYGFYDPDAFHWVGHETEARAGSLTCGEVMELACYPQIAARGSWLLYFVVLLFTGLLALDIAFPMTLFYIRHACDVRDPEPTEFYIFASKVCWFLGILVLAWYYCKALWTVVS